MEFQRVILYSENQTESLSFDHYKKKETPS